MPYRSAPPPEKRMMGNLLWRLADFVIYWIMATFAYRAGIKAERRRHIGEVE